MVCDLCNKNVATVHLTEIINDQMRELHLCEGCAREKGAEMEQHFGLQDMLAGLADIGEELGEEAEDPLTCDVCEMAYRDFRKAGRLGCPACYDAFKKKLTTVLRRIHGSTRHVGKIPARTNQDVSDKLRIQELKRKLQRSVKMEEFEEAARIRDEIRRLEKKGI